MCRLILALVLGIASLGWAGCVDEHALSLAATDELGRPGNPSAPPQATPEGGGASPDETPRGEAGSGSPPAQEPVDDPGGDQGGLPGGPGSGPPTVVDSACGAVGLDVAKLMYSPGGTILPHPCEPFHPTHNNPYAIKCVEAWDWYATDFPGDGFCILPPEPGKGVQIGVHPQGADWYAQVSQGDMSGYQDVPADFLMQPGLETERNYRAAVATDTDQSYYRSYTRMRAGSHHMVVTAVPPNGAPGGWGPESDGGVLNALEGLLGGEILPGAQRPDANVPLSLATPNEDDGLFRILPGGREVIYNMHHFNATDSVTLKEAWQNIWFQADASVFEHGITGMPPFEVFGTFNMPGEVKDHHFSWPALSFDVRLVQLFGHRHAWTSNFSAWIEAPDGDTRLIYQSFDWYDMPTYRYDSVTENPVMSVDALRDGAASGVQVIKAGERLHFNCHMEFTDVRAAQENAPSPTQIGPLRFANEAYAGEMCVLFGSTVGANIGPPIRDLAPVPDFARVD